MLSIEQLKQARKIGATDVSVDTFQLRKDGFYYKDGIWHGSIMAKDYHKHPDIQPIDFTPLDNYYADKAFDIAATGGEESEPPEGWYRDDETGGLKPLRKATIPAQSNAPTRNKYMREIAPGVWIDVYDVLVAWGIINPAQQHLAKKALQAGGRGHKDYITDMKDIIASAERAIELELLRQAKEVTDV